MSSVMVNPDATYSVLSPATLMVPCSVSSSGVDTTKGWSGPLQLRPYRGNAPSSSARESSEQVDAGGDRAIVMSFPSLQVSVSVVALVFAETSGNKARNAVPTTRNLSDIVSKAVRACAFLWEVVVLSATPRKHNSSKEMCPNFRNCFNFE